MLSSIFNSRSWNANHASFFLIGGLAIYFCILEVAMNVALPRISEGERRVRNDYKSAVALRPLNTDGKTSVLIVGNSLLHQGLDRKQLQQAMLPNYAIALFPIEATSYLDWYFGMRRFFAEGARPSAVVMVISARQLVSSATNGEGFAHNMMQLQDILRVADVAHLDMMATSNYFFANISSWIGNRTYFRNGTLEKLMPGARELVGHFSQIDRKKFEATEAIVNLAVERLAQMQMLCEKHGARFILLIPPSANSTDPAPEIRVAANQMGLSVLLPFEPAEMPQTNFADGYHLNETGLQRFTAQSAPILIQTLRQMHLPAEH